jgi:hypothetical protein
MNTLLITYNLNRGDDDYAALFEKIRELGTCWHNASQLDSVWFVRTTLSVAQASKKISSAMDADLDAWVVIDITGQDHQGWAAESLWKFIEA